MTGMPEYNTLDYLKELPTEDRKKTSQKNDLSFGGGEGGI